MIKLTNFFTKKPIYVNESRIQVVESCEMPDGVAKTRVLAPKPIYVCETDEEVVNLIRNSHLQWIPTVSSKEMPITFNYSGQANT